MWQIDNRMPFVAALLPFVGSDSVQRMFVAVKTTFSVGPDAAVSVADRQVPVHLSDVYRDRPGFSALLEASELGPLKSGTDVVLLGHAYAPRPGASRGEVVLEVGSVRRRAVVFGDRVWKSTGAGVIASAPAPFDRVSLAAERAFGGSDRSASRARHHEEEPRNPAGRGFIARTGRAPADILLPNIEDPRDLLTHPSQRPAPMLLGFVAPHWHPRREFGGTYGELWRHERSPLLPLDFDARFFHLAAPEAVARPKLRGGEPVLAIGVAASGPLRFTLPSPKIVVECWALGECFTASLSLETVVLVPDEMRVTQTWKAEIPSNIRLYDLDRVHVHWTGLGT